MLSYGIAHASHVTGLLSSIDGVTNAIDVQMAKKQGRSQARNCQQISQLHVINVQ
jgi:hypothetical protein